MSYNGFYPLTNSKNGTWIIQPKKDSKQTDWAYLVIIIIKNLMENKYLKKTRQIHGYHGTYHNLKQPHYYKGLFDNMN